MLASSIDGDPIHDRHTAGETVYDYLTTEVFDQLGPSEQLLLTRTAFLPSFSVTAAKSLTGLADCEDLLENFIRRNLFTVRHTSNRIYAYHALWQQYLQERATRALGVSSLQSLLRSVANIAAHEGEATVAVRLLRTARAWDEFEQLICNQAAALVAAGRFETLRSWLANVPESEIESRPWVRYWLAMGDFFASPDSAESHLAIAYEQFKALGDPTGTWLTWAGTVDVVALNRHYDPLLDRWISEGERLLAGMQGFPSPEVEARVAAAMLTALAYRDLAHPDIGHWGIRAVELAKSLGSGHNQIHQVTTMAMATAAA